MTRVNQYGCRNLPEYLSVLGTAETTRFDLKAQQNKCIVLFQKDGTVKNKRKRAGLRPNY